MEAVEDRVGGNNHALALIIASEHPGMKPYTNTKEKIHFCPQCIHRMTMLALLNDDGRL